MYWIFKAGEGLMNSAAVYETCIAAGQLRVTTDYVYTGWSNYHSLVLSFGTVADIANYSKVCIDAEASQDSYITDFYVSQANSAALNGATVKLLGRIPKSRTISQLSTKNDRNQKFIRLVTVNSDTTQYVNWLKIYNLWLE